MRLVWAHPSPRAQARDQRPETKGSQQHLSRPSPGATLHAPSVPTTLGTRASLDDVASTLTRLSPSRAQELAQQAHPLPHQGRAEEDGAPRVSAFL